MERNMKKRKKGLLIGTLIILTMLLTSCVIMVGIFSMDNTSQQKMYKEQIRMGENYLMEGNYEEAVVAYQTAIELGEKEENIQPEPYMGLANTYLTQGNIEMARIILEKGYTKTKSAQIQLMIIKFLNKSKEEASPVDYTQLTKNSMNVTLQWNMLKKIMSYPYQNYAEEYGSATAKQEEGGVTLRHKLFFASLYYKNTEDDPDVIDSNSKLPRKDVKPYRISVEQMSYIFSGFTGGISYQRLQELVGKEITIYKNEPKKRYEVHFTIEDLQIHIESDEKGNIIKSDAWNELLPDPTVVKEAEEVQINGQVIDATTNNGVTGATLVFEGENQQKETNTSQTGEYGMELVPGEYTVTVQADGYTTELFENVEISSSGVISMNAFTISPILNKGEIRIVLEWGSAPRDLDAYLTGNTDDGSNVFVNFRNRECMNNQDVIANLDVDEMYGFGPETITIQNLNGVYEFFVFDYHMEHMLGASDATVKIYASDGTSPQVYHVPSAAVDKWVVVRIDHGSIQVVDETPSEVQTTTTEKLE